MLDLELLHFYTTSTWSTISTLSIWQIDLPQMGFEHPCLMHGLLAVAALHLAHLSASRRPQLLVASERHHQQALPQFRDALSNINKENCHACSAFSMNLNVYAWAAPDRPGNLFLVDLNNRDGYQTSVELVKILRGGNSVFRGVREWVAEGPLWSLLKPWLASGWHNQDPTLTPQPVPGQSPQASITAAEDGSRLEHLSASWENSPNVSKEQVGVFGITLSLLRKVFLLTVADNGIEIIQSTLSWPIMIPDSYIALVQSRNPHALVLLAHYCVLLKRVDDRWWIQGKAEHLLGTIRHELGVAWEPWIEWPLQEVGLKGR